MSYYPRIKQGEYVIIDPTGDIISGTEILMCVFRCKVATQTILKLPPIPVKVATLFRGK